MLYLLALMMPPLALLLSGKIFQFIISAIICIVAILLALTLFGLVVGAPLWLLAVIHAVVVVAGHKADKRTDRVVKAMGQSQAPQQPQA
jgi:hypothetical protein